MRVRVRWELDLLVHQAWFFKLGRDRRHTELVHDDADLQVGVGDLQGGERKGWK
jgi:hypothetical protein